MQTLSRAVRSGIAPALMMLSLVGCSSSTPPAEHPTEPSPSAEPQAGPDSSPTSEPSSDGEGAAKKSSSKNSIPDDYELTNRDCNDLGSQFATVIRNDEAAKLSPKLKDKQREQAMGSIEKAATQRQDQWIEGCQKNLVGKTVEHKSLKCAMDAKTVKEFDACLNGPQPEKTEKTEKP